MDKLASQLTLSRSEFLTHDKTKPTLVSTSEDYPLVLDVIKQQHQVFTHDHQLKLIKAKVNEPLSGQVDINDNKILFMPSDDINNLETDDLRIDYVVEDAFGARLSHFVELELPNKTKATTNAPVNVKKDSHKTAIHILKMHRDMNPENEYQLSSAFILGQNQGSVAIDGEQIIFDAGCDFNQLAEGVQETVIIDYSLLTAKGMTIESCISLTVSKKGQQLMVATPLINAYDVNENVLNIDLLKCCQDFTDSMAKVNISDIIFNTQHLGVNSFSVQDNQLSINLNQYQDLPIGAIETLSISFKLYNTFGESQRKQIKIKMTADERQIRVLDVSLCDSIIETQANQSNFLYSYEDEDTVVTFNEA